MTVLFAIGTIAAISILAIWLGYPVLVWARSKWWADPILPDRALAASRHVSVILATRETADAIARRVSNLMDTDHPAERLEVVIALDDVGTAAQPEELQTIPGTIVVVRGDAPGGKAATLNAGVRVATGDVLVLADTAQIFDRRTIPELVAHLEDSRFAAVSGALELGSRNGWTPVEMYWRMEKWLRYHESRVHSSVGVTGAVYATRRATWPILPVGTLLDDVFVPMRLVLAGWRVGFTYAAVAKDVRTFDAKGEAARKTRTLTGILQLIEVLPDVMTPANPIRFAFMIHKLARLATPLLLIIAVAGIMGGVGLLLSRHPTIVLGLLAAIVTILLVVPSIRRRLYESAYWVVVLQRAVFTALMNGMNRRWSVWNR